MFKAISITISVVREVPLWIEQINTFEKTLMDLIRSCTDSLYENNTSIEECGLIIKLTLGFQAERAIGQWKKVNDKKIVEGDSIMVAEDVLHKVMPAFESIMKSIYGLEVCPDGYECVLRFKDSFEKGIYRTLDLKVYKEMTFNKDLVAAASQK